MAIGSVGLGCCRERFSRCFTQAASFARPVALRAARRHIAKHRDGLIEQGAVLPVERLMDEPDLYFDRDVRGRPITRRTHRTPIRGEATAPSGHPTRGGRRETCGFRETGGPHGERLGFCRCKTLSQKTIVVQRYLRQGLRRC